MDNTYPIINLAGHKRDLRVQQNLDKKRLISTSMMVTGVYLVVLVVVSVVRFLLINQFEGVEKDISSTKASISGMEAKETKYRLISSKLSELSVFIDTKKPIEPKINKIYAIMPGGVVIDDISFGESDEILAVRVSANNVFDVGELLSVVSQAVTDDFSQIIVSSTRRDDLGVYQLDLEFHFGNG